MKEFKVYQDEILVKTVEPYHNNMQTITDLKAGEYRLEYQTKFKKTVSVPVVLSDNNTTNIKLCFEHLDYELETYIPFINQLKSHESYTIQFSSHGCFHWTEEEIIIKKKGDDYYAVFNKNEQLLTQEHITAIRHFEWELNYMENVGCTTTDIYVVKYKNKEVKISDGSCSWSGWHYLMQKLGLKAE